MSSQYPHQNELTRSTSGYNPDEINIDGITDYLSTLQTSTPYDQSQQTPFTLLQGDAPVYRSIMMPEEVITQEPQQHVSKDLGDVTISLDAYGQPHSHAEDYYGSLRIPSPHTPIPVSLPTTLHHHNTIFSPHTPPSFEQQASTQSLPPSSPTLSTDSSSSSSVSVSYSTSHIDTEYPPPAHDSLMRNDSCLSVYHEISHRRDDIIDDVESEIEDSDSCMPDADSDDLPPINVFPRLMRQNGVYRQPSITSF